MGIVQYMRFVQRSKSKQYDLKTAGVSEKDTPVIIITLINGQKL